MVFSANEIFFANFASIFLLDSFKSIKCSRSFLNFLYSLENFSSFSGFCFSLNLILNLTSTFEGITFTASLPVSMLVIEALVGGKLLLPLSSSPFNNGSIYFLHYCKWVLTLGADKQHGLVFHTQLTCHFKLPLLPILTVSPISSLFVGSPTIHISGI